MFDLDKYDKVDYIVKVIDKMFYFGGYIKIGYVLDKVCLKVFKGLKKDWKLLLKVVLVLIDGML